MNSKEFSLKNKMFLDQFSKSEIKGTLLIESPHLCFITHCLAMQALLLRNAKGFKPLWMYNKKTPLELLQSYDSAATFLKSPKISLLIIFKVGFTCLLQFLVIIFNRRILNFKYDGVKYGDIVYDSFLSEQQIGTIQNINLGILKLMFFCAYNHEKYKLIIKKNKIDAVLTSHRIGKHSGVIVRSALKSGCDVYTSNGMHRNTLFRSRALIEMIDYEYTPKDKDIESLVSLNDEDFNKLYNFVLDFHVNGNCSMDAKFAFSDTKKYFKDRIEFSEFYRVDKKKKNVFVMLHAFNDHPHSHFNWMIFKDYADWFFKTLEYAESDSSVNWFFKRHPSDKYYPTRDIDFKKIFNNSPSNVIFLDENDKLDTRSLIYVSDAIITCIGSAGFEIPAMAGIPSITAGDNHYSGLGFSINPTDKDEYFSVLKELYKVKKLSPEVHKKAKATYIFIYYLSTVDYSFIPILSHDDHHDKNFDEKFWGMVFKLYETRKDKIYNELSKYSLLISKRDFKALRTLLQDSTIAK